MYAVYIHINRPINKAAQRGSVVEGHGRMHHRVQQL